MPTCCDCGKDVSKAGFAKSQLKKPAEKRRCKGCAEPLAGESAVHAASKTEQNNAASNRDDVRGDDQTPYDKCFARLKVVQKNHDALGPMLIEGIPRDDDEEDSSDDDEDGEKAKAYNASLTEEQVESLRFVLITQNREDQLDAMRKYVLGDQANDGLLMFNTSFSYQIHDGFYEFKSNLYSKSKTWSAKFDLLFAYTYNIKEHDVWMHDNEGDMDVMVRDLAKLWKTILSKDNTTLGIDAEYTRPGVLAFLEQFKEAVEGTETYSYPPFKFKYQ